MSQKTAIVSGVMGAAMFIAVPFIVSLEGESLQAYQDVAGVWTICHGETLNVRQGDVKTKPECDRMTNSRVGEFMGRVYGFIRPDVAPHQLAAFTSFAYNVGVDGFGRSEALRRFNAGDFVGGCVAMKNWYRAGGRDCRQDKGNPRGCYGLINRRNKEINLCVRGVPYGVDYFAKT